MMSLWVRIPVTLLVGAAVLPSINQTSRTQPVRETGSPSQNAPYMDPQIAEQWAAVHLDGQGQYFVRTFGSTIEKMDSRGSRRWGFSTRSHDELPALDVLASAPAGPGTLVAVGLTVAEPVRALVFRVRDQGSGPAVEVVGTYDIEPSSIAVAPSGEIYVYGIVSTRLAEPLRAVAHGPAPRTIETPMLHEIAPGGELVRSMLVRRLEVHSVREIIEFVSETVRVAIDPEGKVYLYHPDKMVLEMVDLDSELTAGRVVLPYAGMLEPGLRGLLFVDSSTVLYSVTHREGMRLGETQTWLFNIETGQSRMLLKAPREATEAHFDFDTGEIVVSTGIGSSARPRQFERFSDWESRDIGVTPRGSSRN